MPRPTVDGLLFTAFCLSPTSPLYIWPVDVVTVDGWKRKYLWGKEKKIQKCRKSVGFDTQDGRLELFGATNEGRLDQIADVSAGQHVRSIGLVGGRDVVTSADSGSVARWSS